MPPFTIHRTLSLGMVAALLAAAMLVLAPPGPADAACPRYTNHYDFSSGSYKWATFQEIPGNSTCSDVNIEYTRLGTTHRGQYWKNGGWVYSTVGAKYLSQGWQSPWKVVVTDMRNGGYARVGTIAGGWGYMRL